MKVAVLQNRSTLLLVVLGVLLVFLAAASPARAETIPVVVTSGADDGTANAANCPGTGCRLRDALAKAVSGDTINFAGNFSIFPIGRLTIGKDLTIDGAGYAVSVWGNGTAPGGGTPLFDVSSGATVKLQNLSVTQGWTDSGDVKRKGAGIYNAGTLALTNVTLSGNVAGFSSKFEDDGFFGGAIYNASGGKVEVTNSTFSENSAFRGGAIYNAGRLVVFNSTFSGNMATAGGAIYNDSAGTVTVTNSTFSRNVAPAPDGGGIMNLGTAEFTNTIMFLSSCDGGVAIGSTNNLIDANTVTACGSFTSSDAVLLGALGSYGGSTQTFPLLPGSAAIDAGDDAACQDAATVNNVDQRGVPRPQGDHCDIGAFESRSFDLTQTGGDSQSTPVNWPFADPLAVGVTSPSGDPVDGGQVTFTASTGAASATFTVNPAAISGGKASVTAVANATLGGPYTVAAGAAGAASVNFSLTNIDCVAALTVTNGNNSGAGSLRNAIIAACEGGAITFADDYTVLLEDKLTINRRLTIDGGTHPPTISGNHVTTVFEVSENVTCDLRNLTVANGGCAGSGAGCVGGGVTNLGTLTVSNSTFSGNTGSLGGGIYNVDGTLTVMNSTFAGNTGPHGGGIANVGDTLTVINCTFSGNSAAGPSLIPEFLPVGGDGIWNAYGGRATVRNSIFANSLTSSNCLNVSGAYGGGAISGTNNLADDNSCGAGFAHSSAILLGALGYNGGSTQTFPLLPGSAAIDAGDDAACQDAATVNNVDQRGVPRPQGDHCDIGAFESRGFVLGSLSGTPQTATIKTAFALPLGLTVTAKEPSEPVNGGQVMFRAPSSGASTTFGPTAVATIAGGAVSMPATANGTGGSYAVVASAAGAEDASFSLTNKLEADTATTLTASPNPSVTGQQVTFTASVTSSGAPVMSGTVAFKDAGNNNNIGGCNAQSLDGAGHATCSVSTLAAVSHTIMAVYGGQTDLYSASESGPYAQTVNRAGTATVLTSTSPNPSAVGQPVTFTAVVQAAAPGAGMPAGTVTFYENVPASSELRAQAAGAGSPSNAVTLSGGKAEFTTSALSAGSHSMVAVYSGDAGFDGSTSSAYVQTVNSTTPGTGTAYITGVVFNDANGNGKKEKGDMGLTGWSVELRNTGGDLLMTATTAGDGVYTFTALTAGVYRVREVRQDSYVQTTANPANLSLAAGSAIKGVNFGNVVSADLNITQEAAYDLTAKTIRYTIVVRNDGPANAANAVMEDPLPGGVSYVSATATLGTCSGTKTVKCSFGTLASGSSATVTLTVKRTNMRDPIKNTVKATSTTFDLDKSDNSATKTVP